MGFNLYFAGSRTEGVEQYLQSLGGRRLFSQYHDRSSIADRVNKGLSTFIDSGAFTAHTKGIDVDVDEYVNYVNGIDDYVDLIAQVDKIPGEFAKPKTSEQLAEAPELSWQNYLYMRDRVKSIDKLLPIFHQGEDFAHLRRMLDFRPKIDYIGISPANDASTPNKEKWIAHVFAVISKSNNREVKTHAFGMTNLPTLERFPFYSADSATWLRASSYGGIRSPYGVVNVSEKMKKMPDHISHLSAYHQEEIRKYVEDRGFTLDALKEDYKERMKISILFYVEWARDYVYRPRVSVQTKLF